MSQKSDFFFLGGGGGFLEIGQKTYFLRLGTQPNIGYQNREETWYSLLSIPRISRDWAKYVELSVVRGNQIMTYTYHFGAK